MVAEGGMNLLLPAFESLLEYLGQSVDAAIAYALA